MKQIICFFTLLSLLHPFDGMSQKSEPQPLLAGQVIQQEAGTPVEYATVRIFSEHDSSLVAGGVTDAGGKFAITVPAGTYYVKIDFLGFKTRLLKNVVVTANNDIQHHHDNDTDHSDDSHKHSGPEHTELGILSMTPSEVSLSEVEVVGEKSRLELQIDKKIFHVGKDIASTGGSALEVLDNVPSVTVDMDGNVQLRGSSNVRVLIDGKPSVLTGISGTEALNSISAQSIERIEVVTNPSAKYDAEGNTGIINIILNKGKQKGLNSTITVTAAYPHDHSLSVNFNLRKKKFNLFGGIGSSYEYTPWRIRNNREMFNEPDTARIYTESDRDELHPFGTIQLGSDYFINNRNTITASAVLHFSKHITTSATTYNYYNAGQTLIGAGERAGEQDETHNKGDFSLRYERKYKMPDQKLTADVQYSTGLEDGTEQLDEWTVESIPPGDTVKDLFTTSEGESDLVAMCDYTHPAGRGGIETGVKATNRRISHDFEGSRFDPAGGSGQWEVIPSVSNNFLYSEDVYAGYFLYKAKNAAWEYSAGLRAEQTFVGSELSGTHDSFDDQYLHFFPSVHLSRMMNEKHQLFLSYSRRIQRPGFRMLNPIFNYTDRLNRWQGNPDIDPSTTHSMEAGYMRKGESLTFNTTLYYRHTDDAIARIRTIDPETGVMLMTPYNLNYRKSSGAEFIFTAAPIKWWDVDISADIYGFSEDASNVDSNYATGTDISGDGRINSRFKILKVWTLQMLLNYRAPTKTTQGVRKGMYFVDMAVRRSMFRNRAMISARVSDVFDTRRFFVDTEEQNYRISTEFSHWTRRFYLSFTWNMNYKGKQLKHEHEEEIGF